MFIYSKKKTCSTLISEDGSFSTKISKGVPFLHRRNHFYLEDEIDRE